MVQRTGCTGRLVGRACLLQARASAFMIRSDAARLVLGRRCPFVISLALLDRHAARRPPPCLCLCLLLRCPRACAAPGRAIGPLRRCMSRVMTADGIVASSLLRFQISPVAKPATLRICACSLRQQNPAQPACVANCQPAASGPRCPLSDGTMPPRPKCVAPPGWGWRINSWSSQPCSVAVHGPQTRCANPIEMNRPGMPGPANKDPASSRGPSSTAAPSLAKKQSHSQSQSQSQGERRLRLSAASHGFTLAGSKQCRRPPATRTWTPVRERSRYWRNATWMTSELPALAYCLPCWAACIHTSTPFLGPRWSSMHAPTPAAQSRRAPQIGHHRCMRFCCEAMPIATHRHALNRLLISTSRPCSPPIMPAQDAAYREIMGEHQRSPVHAIHGRRLWRVPMHYPGIAVVCTRIPPRRLAWLDRGATALGRLSTRISSAHNHLAFALMA